jgi:hypothetical protein
MPERLPPQNIEAEEAVLGAILIDPDGILYVRNTLKPSDFYREKNAWVYGAALSLHEKREPIDFVTLCDELDHNGQLSELGGRAFITKLINAVPTSINIEYYADRIVQAANNRRLIDVARKIAVVAYQSDNSSDAYAQAATMLRDMEMSGKLSDAQGGDKLGAEMLLDLVAMQREKDDRKSGQYEPVWPWPKMRAMARWRIGQPVGLIAEGGAGKTAFCTAVGIYNATNGGKIFYVATEDQPQTLRLRQMSSISGVPHRQIETMEYGEEKMCKLSIYGADLEVPERLVSAVRSVDTWRGSLHLVPGTGRTIPEIVYDLSRLEMRVGKPDAVIFDWFLDHKRRDTENETIGLTRDLYDLKVYASESKTRIMVATQTGKSGAAKSRLTAIDAFWTSAFAHYGKLVMALKREREMVHGEPIGQFKPDIEVFISKANLDRTGSFKLRMRGETLSIFEPEIKDSGYAF